MKLSGTITKVSGPLVVANGLADANVSDVVRVGEQRLIGEILNMTGDSASIQVYEETSGLGPGAEVETTGMPLSVELGPGMLENIYDGIQRPLPEIRDLTGSNITRGIEVPALNRERVWHFDPVVQPGTAVTGGDVIGTVQETTAILHKIMVPPQMKGTIKSKEDVERLFSRGRRSTSSFMTILVRENTSSIQGRCAFIAGKKLGTAPLRNRCKRVMREVARNIGAPFEGYDIAFVAKKKVAFEKHEEIMRQARRSLAKLGVMDESA